MCGSPVQREIIYRLPATRDAAPRRTNAGRGRRMLGYRADQLDRRKGHFKVPGVGNRWDVLGGIPRLCVITSRASPWLEEVRAGVLTRRLFAARARGCIACDIPR